eukprot:5826942-Ditylum_brightwellii.AAC.1
MDAILQVIKGQDIQDLEAAYTMVKSLLRGDALQVFQNKEANQEIRDGPAFTKCLVAVTEHMFPKKVYKIHKKYIWNIRKPLRLGSFKWILQMIKLNDYLVNFPVSEGVMANKLSRKEFVDVLEDGILFQWKLEFKKEGFDSSSTKLKEFLDTCMCLEEAELHKLLVKKIACIKKERDKDRKGKCHGKSESRHKRHHSQGKCPTGKHKKKYCDYHGLCHHDKKKCKYYQACRKHVQPTHHITEDQRLWQVQFVKDAKSCTKKCNLSAREVKNLNKFIKDKIDETIKQSDCNMHAMSNFEDLSISSSNKSVQSIIRVQYTT